MKHRWEPDTASVRICACGTKSRTITRPARSRTSSESKSKPEYLAPGASTWTTSLPPCTRQRDESTLKRDAGKPRTGRHAKRNAA